ncbi:hypothetical protein ONE63_005046 [Megalurothrips usitatus]|uniref:Cytochrome P450 n=1 Tax=Megalurothrips usitatus TaxID=439358 RepID=A0AAV7X1M5_9NEOP|nr:hypothetical protein ONE63_005046 [Megalurothrips usitatus]
MTELAHNPDVQDKARAEVQRVLAKHGGQIPYEALQDLTYVEQVIDGEAKHGCRAGAANKITPGEWVRESQSCMSTVLAADGPRQSFMLLQCLLHRNM